MTVQGTFVFLCASCSYKARVPDEYRGATILCPGCHRPQLAVPAAAGPSTGRTVSLLRVPTVAAAPPPEPPRPAPPIARPATHPYARQPSSAGEPADGTIEFCCSACSVRVRIPAHYLGRSILCPRCSTPQQAVDASAPMRPMDTTRSLRSGGAGPVAEVVATPVEPRPDTTDMVPQRASVLPGQALEPEPGVARPATDALTRADARRRESTAEPPPHDETVTAPRAQERGTTTQRRRAAAPPPGRTWPLIALALLAGLLLTGLVLALVAWREAAARSETLGEEIRHLRQDIERLRAPAPGRDQ